MGAHGAARPGRSQLSSRVEVPFTWLAGMNRCLQTISSSAAPGVRPAANAPMLAHRQDAARRRAAVGGRSVCWPPLGKATCRLRPMAKYALLGMGAILAG